MTTKSRRDILLRTSKGRRVMLVGIIYTTIIAFTFGTLYLVLPELIVAVLAVAYLGLITVNGVSTAPTLRKTLLLVAVVGVLPLLLSIFGIILVTG